MNWFGWLFTVVASVAFAGAFIGALYLIFTNRKEERRKNLRKRR